MTLSSWIGCCGSFQKDSSVKFTPSNKRSCTDILWLVLYAIAWAGVIAIIFEARRKGGNPNRIIHGVDYKGRICGTDKGVENLDYSAWIAIPKTQADRDNCQGCYRIKTCLPDCASASMTNIPGLDVSPSPILVNTRPLYTNYDSLMYLCLPLPFTAAESETWNDSYDSDFNSASELASRAFADLYLTWPIILISAGIALVLSYIYEWLSKRWAGVLVWGAVLLLTTGGFLASYALLQKAADIDSTVANSRKTAMRGVGILLAILTGLFLIIVIALRKRIYIAVEVIKSAGNAVLDMMAIVFFPILPFIIGVMYFVFFIATTVLLASAWTSKDAPWPAYITANTVNTGLNGGATTVPRYDFDYDQDLRNSFAFVFFHLLWTAQLLIYFTYMVIAGATANWYFTPRDASGSKIRGYKEGQLSPSPVLDSFFRTLRYHMGTIALGALIIATIEFIRACVKYIERQTAAANGGQPNRIQRILFCLIQCCLWCIQCCMDKISKNAFIWTAIWGDAYAPAACSSFTLIWANLARVAALSIVTNYILFVGKILVAFLTTGIAGVAMFRYYGRELNSPVLPMVVVFVLSYMVAALFMSVVETVIDTVFICFLVDEKYNKQSGTMLADKGLQEVINAHSDYCQEHAKREELHSNLRPGQGNAAGAGASTTAV